MGASQTVAGSFPSGTGERVGSEAAPADVLIVGAGPAGTSTAFALLQAGLTVTIVDRAHFPRSKACAEYLSPQASRILEAMDVLRPVERSDAALRGGELLAPFVATAARALAPAAADRALAAYGRAHAEEFRGKRVIERLIGVAVSRPWLFNRVARVLAVRQEMADLLVGVAGDFVPASAVLRPRFLFDLLRPAPR